MRADLLARLGHLDPRRDVWPLWALVNRVTDKNLDMAEANLLSLSYGRVIRKKIDEVGGLRPESYETYNIIEAGDVVLRMTDLQNDQRSIRTAMATERGIITSAYVTVRPDPSRVDPRFLAAALLAYDIQKVYYEMGAGVRQTLKFEELSNLPIPLPTLSVQRRIADFLDRETAEIDAMDVELDRLVETLQERRSSMVRRALTGYPLVAMGYHCRIVNGSTPLISRTDYWTESGGFPWLNSSAVNEAVVVQASREVTPAALRECHLPLVHPGDLLIGITGQGRTRGMVAMSGVECTISQHLAAIQPQSGWEAKFLYYALTADYLELRQQSEGAGSTKGAITCQMLTQYKVPLPPLPEQQRIVAELDEQTGRIDSMIADARRLKALLTERRTTLITDVVTGRKEVA